MLIHVLCFIVGVLVGCRSAGVPWLKSATTAIFGWIGVVAKEIRDVAVTVFTKAKNLF